MAFNLREARRAMAVLDRDPDDTVAAIRAIGAMAGNSGERLFRRFRRSSKGRKILENRQELFEVLSDLDRLGRMPEGSLGKALWRFYTDEELSAEGLRQASEAAGGAGAADTDENRFARRMRELHDVLHVVTGYGRDLRGEAGCLAFTVAQTWNTGLGYLVWNSVRNAGWFSEHGRFVRHAFRRGRRAQWLVDQDWESLMDEDLEALRERLGVGPAPVYEQVRSAGAPRLDAA